MPSSPESCQGRSRPAAGPTCSAAYPHMGNHPWSQFPLSCPNTSPVSGTASTECPGNAPLRGTLALLPAPIPALLSSPSPTLSLEEPKPKGRKGPSCSPGLTSRQHTLLDPDQHTEQSRRGNAPFGKPPPATHSHPLLGNGSSPTICPRGAPNPRGNTATIILTQTFQQLQIRQ